MKPEACTKPDCVAAGVYHFHSRDDYIWTLESIPAGQEHRIADHNDAILRARREQALRERA